MLVFNPSSQYINNCLVAIMSRITSSQKLKIQFHIEVLALLTICIKIKHKLMLINFNILSRNKTTLN